MIYFLRSSREQRATDVPLREFLSDIRSIFKSETFRPLRNVRKTTNDASVKKKVTYDNIPTNICCPVNAHFCINV